jgi:hypothetical protein
LRQSAKIHPQYQGLPLLFYRAALPLSRKTLSCAAGIIRRHRKAIGSRWRRLDPGQQALLVLACLRKGETFAGLAAGFGAGVATAWRHGGETVALLAARAPKLRRAVRDAQKAGHACVVPDGTLIPIGRVAADRPFYSGKHQRHGMNLQVIASPHGDIRRVSGALPGSVRDKKAERVRGVLDELDELEAAGLVTLAGKGYRAAPGPRSRTREGTNPNRRNRPTAPTRNFAPREKGQTRSSRPGAFSVSCAAAPGAPASSPRRSTHWRFRRHNQDGKGSVYDP